MSESPSISQGSESRIVWMDLEMTGLDPEQDAIIEIATLITDANLDILEEGPELVVHQPPEAFDKMDNWNQQHHTRSGLWAKVLDSKLDIAAAEDLTLDFIKQHIPEKTCPLAGNSIWQDRRFISKYMKKTDAYLHYRMIDVSSFKEVAGRWYPDMKNFEKKNAHRALDDIKESIEELKHYRKELFR